MHFQWYPGHMTKAKRMMQEDIKLIDLVIELVDARIPMSSRNPDIDELGKNKARLILLNKSDLAEDKQNDAWAAYFKEKGYSVVKVNSKKGGGIKSIQGVIQEACKEKIERDRKRGILNRPVRAMVVGIPNVGKHFLWFRHSNRNKFFSSFIFTYPENDRTAERICKGGICLPNAVWNTALCCFDLNIYLFGRLENFIQINHFNSPSLQIYL